MTNVRDGHVKVHSRVDIDEDGWPPASVESLWPWPSATAPRLGTTGEGIERFRMVAPDVPPRADLPRVRWLLEHGATEGWWHWEEGCVTAAWRPTAMD
ncbi:DUF4265 domain-containing protein [Streptomyces sp. NPDC059176]|uniref:DUF4265 domain-containing protein n=1 Tax=unclassified Streptomyces TaxID=2593676 RepID=UPI0036C3B70A